MNTDSIHRARGAVGVALAFCALSASAQITIGVGSAVQLGAGVLRAGCLDLRVDGQLALNQGATTGLRNLGIGATGQVDGGSGRLSLSGNFDNAGVFKAGTGEVRSVDGCGIAISTFTGDTRFNRLIVQTSSGRTLALQAGSTLTVQSEFALSGVSGRPLLVRSTVPGFAASVNLLPEATQSIAYVDVADNRATGQVVGQGTPASFNSIMGPNTGGWFIPAGSREVAAIPTLGEWALLLLATLLGALGLRRARTRGR